MIFALFALSALALFFFVRGISQHVPAPEIVEPVQIAGPEPIWCTKDSACYEPYNHDGPHIPFGSFSVAETMSRPLSDSYADYIEGYPDGGKHRGAPEATLAQYSGYAPKRGAGIKGL
jgi:hypothetical protein